MPRPLAITHVLIYRQFGGMERYVLELCRWMKARGHAPSLLLSTGSPVADAARALEIPVRLAPIAGDANPLAPWHVARAVRQWGAELLNVHDNDSAVPCCLGGRLAGVPVVATVHAFHSSRWPFIAADHLLAVSAALGGHLRGQGFPAERVSVIRSGVDVAHFVPSDQRQARRDLGLAPEGVYFASTSRLSRGKGLALLIDAFTGVRPQAPHARLLLAGRGPLEEALRNQVRERGLVDVVRFLGFQEDVRPVLAAADCLVLPSQSEGLGLVILEAMAAGRAVIASAVGGTREIIRDGVTGLLIDPLTEETLRQALLRVAGDPCWAAAAGMAGRQWAVEDHALDAQLAEVEAFYYRIRTRKGTEPRLRETCP